MGSLRSTREVVVWSEALVVIDRKIDGALAAVESAEDLRAMGKAQGRLEALRELRQLPAAMLAADELEQADERNREAIRLSQDPANWRRETAAPGR